MAIVIKRCTRGLKDLPAIFIVQILVRLQVVGHEHGRAVIIAVAVNGLVTGRELFAFGF